MNDPVPRLEAVLTVLENAAMPILFSLILFELLILWCRRKWISKKESWVSLAGYGLGSLPYYAFFGLLQFQIMMWMYDHARLFTLGNRWYVWALAFIAFDCAWWLVHFAAHKIRFLWCIHGAHHTPKEMNLSVAIRGSLFDFFQYVHLGIWLPILGFHPFMVFSVEIISRLYGVFTHAHKDYIPHTPTLDHVLITPSLHTAHHARNPLYIDTNFSNLFSFWDKLFGTFRPLAKDVEPVFGVTDESIDPESIWSSQFGLWKSLFADIRSTPKWADKIAYVFMPPGWAPRSEPSPPVVEWAREAA